MPKREPNPQERLDAVRKRIDENTAELRRVTALPPPFGEALARAHATLDMADQRAGINVSALLARDGDGPVELERLFLRDRYNVRPEVHLRWLLASLNRPHLEEQIAGALHAQLDDAETISGTDRAVRLADLARERHELETEEEALVQQLEMQGVDVERRPDAPVDIVLGIAG